MYAIINSHNEIVDFENRSLPLEELVHSDFIKYYIDISNSKNLKLGDMWNPETKDWTIVDIPEPITPIPTPQYHEPSNIEIAQMISDLQADLIIAGVI